MWVPWKLTEGPEYAESLEAARERSGDSKRFDDHLNVMRYALKRDPEGSSYPFLEQDDRLRVLMTHDPNAGYELVIFFEIIREYHCELKWVEIRPLGAEET